MTNKEKIITYINKIKEIKSDNNLDAIEKLNYQELLKALEEDTIKYNNYIFMNMCPIDGLCGFHCDGRCLKSLGEDSLNDRKMSCWKKALEEDKES